MRATPGDLRSADPNAWRRSPRARLDASPAAHAPQRRISEEVIIYIRTRGAIIRPACLSAALRVHDRGAPRDAKEDAMFWSGTQGRRASTRTCGWMLVLLLAAAAPALAQFDRGAISGTIKDQQGGVMPGVTVTALNTQTQQSQNTVTDSSGFYTFPNLLPGRYDVLAEITGFRKVSRQNVPLDANGSITLDFSLQT